MSLTAGWWRALRLLGRIERIAGVSLIVLIVVTITIQVITRYFFSWPLVWVEELAQYSFIWMVFIGAALGFKEIRHIRIDTFVDKMPMAARSVWRAALYALMTCATLFLGYSAWDIMSIEGKSNTVSLPIELPRMWFYSVPMCYSMLSISLTGLYFVLAYLQRAFTGRPVDAELDVLERARLDAEEEAARTRQVRSGRAGANRRPIMAITLMFVVMFGLIALEMPVAVALILASLSYLFLGSMIPPSVVVQRMAPGIDSFPLLAIPLFVLAGNLLNVGGNCLADFRVCDIGGLAICVVVWRK